MRVVYDDTMQKALLDIADKFLINFPVEDIVRYDYGMDRVQMHMLRDRLDNWLQAFCSMEIGKKVTHDNGLGNNCRYPVFYYPDGIDEIQKCAYININTGIYSSGTVSLENYDGKRISPVYEVTTRGIFRKE